MKSVKVTLPTFCAAYLIMNDGEGVSAADRKAVAAALKYEFSEPTSWDCVDMDADSVHFGQFGGLGCELAEFTFLLAR